MAITSFQAISKTALRENVIYRNFQLVIKLEMM